MSVVPGKESFNALVSEMNSHIQSRTGINANSKSSRSKSLQEIFVNQLVVSKRDVIEAFQSMSIDKKGSDLDRIGEDLGVSRQPPTKASVSASDTVMAIYVDSGTFGDLNTSTDIELPSGTIIQSLPIANDSNRQIIYRLTSDTTLPASDALSYVSVRADGFGSKYNVGKGVLVSLDFSDYTAGTGLKCSNLYPILNGRDQQTDRSYRFALANYFASLPIVNNIRLQLSALNIPGVIDSIVSTNYYGIGTSAVIVLGPEYRVTNRLLSSVQNYLDSVALPNTQLYAVPATVANFSLSLTVKKTKDYTEEEKLSIKNFVTQKARIYLRNKGIGGVIVLDELYRYVTEELSSVVFVKTNVTAFDKVQVSRSEPNQSHSAYENIIGRSYSLDDIEYGDLDLVNISYR